MQWLGWLILVGTIAIGLFEIVLRVGFGFGNPQLYLAEPDIGYRLAPNQNVRRFGRRIMINRYSMRNAENFVGQPPATTLRVLLLGDSIVNGGWWTDQSATISELLRNRLQAWTHPPTQRSRRIAAPPAAASSQAIAPPNASSDQSPVTPNTVPLSKIEVLNASANSWGPRNELAYLKRFGTFNADVLVLVINTDDLFAGLPDSRHIGRKVTYPDRKPVLAIAEFIQRNYLPEPTFPPLPEPGSSIERANFAAIGEIQALLAAEKIPLLVVLTPLVREVELNQRDYEQRARQWLAEFLADRQIPWVDLLPLMRAEIERGEHQPTDFFRDNIHLNDLGNALLVGQIQQAIEPLLADRLASLPTQSF